MVSLITAKTLTVKVSHCSNGILFLRTIITYSKVTFRMEIPQSTIIMMKMVLIVIQTRSRCTNLIIARFLNQDLTLVVTTILTSCTTVVQMETFIAQLTQQTYGKPNRQQPFTIKRQNRTNAKVLYPEKYLSIIIFVYNAYLLYIKFIIKGLKANLLHQYSSQYYLASILHQ